MPSGPIPMARPMALDDRAEWFEEFLNKIAERVEHGGRFSNDDLRRDMPEPFVSNWWGTAFRKAAASGLIKRVGYKKSKTKSRNSGVQSIWEPLPKGRSDVSEAEQDRG